MTTLDPTASVFEYIQNKTFSPHASVACSVPSRVPPREYLPKGKENRKKNKKGKGKANIQSKDRNVQNERLPPSADTQSDRTTAPHTHHRSRQSGGRRHRKRRANSASSFSSQYLNAAQTYMDGDGYIYSATGEVLNAPGPIFAASHCQNQAPWYPHPYPQSSHQNDESAATPGAQPHCPPNPSLFLLPAEYAAYAPVQAVDWGSVQPASMYDVRQLARSTLAQELLVRYGAAYAESCTRNPPTPPPPPSPAQDSDAHQEPSHPPSAEGVSPPVLTTIAREVATDALSMAGSALDVVQSLGCDVCLLRTLANPSHPPFFSSSSPSSAASSSTAVSPPTTPDSIDVAGPGGSSSEETSAPPAAAAAAEQEEPHAWWDMVQSWGAPAWCLGVLAVRLGAMRLEAQRLEEMTCEEVMWLCAEGCGVVGLHGD